MKKVIKILILIFILMLALEAPTFAKYENSTWDEFYDKFYEEYQKNGGKDLSDKDIQRAIDGPKPMKNKLDEGYTRDDAGGLEDIKEKALGLQNIKKNTNEKQKENSGTDPTITGKDDEKAKELKKKIIDKKSSKGYNPSKMTVQELREWEGIITDYSIAVGGISNVEEDITAMYGELDSELRSRGEAGRNIT